MARALWGATTAGCFPAGPRYRPRRTARFHCLTSTRLRRFSFRDAEFVPVQAPAAVRSLPELGGGVVERRYAGGLARVTTLERTLVDVLDAPQRCGGWEEVWRSLEMVEFFDFDVVIEYAGRLGSALTAARVGLFLERHREQLMVGRVARTGTFPLPPVVRSWPDSHADPLWSQALVRTWSRTAMLAGHDPSFTHRLEATFAPARIDKEKPPESSPPPQGRRPPTSSPAPGIELE